MSGTEWALHKSSKRPSCSHTLGVYQTCALHRKISTSNKIAKTNSSSRRENNSDWLTYLCLACCIAFLLLSSSSLLLASSSWVRVLGAGLGGIAGSWMKGCEGWTWVDDELGMVVDAEDGLRSCAETQGCTAPGRSTEVGRGDSLLVPVLLELLVLLLDKHQGGRTDRVRQLFRWLNTQNTNVSKNNNNWTNVRWWTLHSHGNWSCSTLNDKNVKHIKVLPCLLNVFYKQNGVMSLLFTPHQRQKHMLFKCFLFLIVFL